MSLGSIGQPMNRVVNHLRHRGTVADLDRVFDLHAPCWLQIGELKRHGFVIYRNIPDSELLLVVMIRAIVGRSLERPRLDVNTLWVDGVRSQRLGKRKYKF